MFNDYGMFCYALRNQRDNENNHIYYYRRNCRVNNQHRKVYKVDDTLYIMTDEPTNKTDTSGNEDNKKQESNEAIPKQPTSLYDKTEAIVTRQEEANKKTEELLKRQETLFANQRLAGTTGGNVEVKTVSPEDKKTAQAKEFFKDTALGDAIKKTNE